MPAQAMARAESRIVRSRAWVLLPLAVCYLGVFYCLKVSPRSDKIDFGSYYVWGFAARHGLDPYRPQAVTEVSKALAVDAVPDNYPPLTLLAFEPLSMLPVRAAFWSWCVINLSLAIAAIGLTVGIAGKRGSIGIIVALALLYGPLSDELYWGESDLISLLLLVLYFRALSRRANGASGVWVAIAALWKAFPGILLASFVFERRLRQLLLAIAVILAGAGILLVLFGVELNLEFIKSAWQSGSSLLLPYAENGSFASLISRTTGRADVTQGLVLLIDVVLFLLALQGASAANSNGRPEFAFALWVAWMVTLLPAVWLHRLIFLLFVLVLLARADGTSPRARHAGVVTYVLAEAGLVAAWVRWSTYPAHDELAQAVLGVIAFATMAAGFAAAYLMCIDTRRHDFR